jgi:NADH-quinone oxidoreductase subunit E
MSGCHCACDHKAACSSVDIESLEPVLAEYAGDKGSLIPILQKAQELYGYLPADLLAYIARRLGVKPAKVMGVVTFYTQFRTKPTGKNFILLWQGTACHVNGSGEIEKAIKDYLQTEEGEVTPDGLFSYDSVACIGCCSLSPVMMINGKAYGNLTKESAVGILEKLKGAMI